MAIQMGQLFIYSRAQPASLRDFVEFWSERYYYPNDDLYTKNIGGRYTAEGLYELFKWKIGNMLFENKRPLVERHFIDRSAEAETLVKELASCQICDIAQRFLDHFKQGGAIWRIFWLHCWDTCLPIYDQHVHRAMTFINDNGQMDELGKHNDERKVQLYLDRYLPFFNEFREMDGRKVDRALWRFGKSLLDNSLPPRHAIRNPRQVSS